MDIARIKHLLLQKSTWILIIAQVGNILQLTGVLDDIGLKNYTAISMSVILILSAIGVFGIYNTEPIKSDDTTNL